VLVVFYCYLSTYLLRTEVVEPVVVSVAMSTERVVAEVFEAGMLVF
jgi:hypothetical protein